MKKILSLNFFKYLGYGLLIALLFLIPNYSQGKIINFGENLSTIKEKFKQNQEINILQFGDGHTVSGYGKHLSNYLKLLNPNFKFFSHGQNGSKFHRLSQDQKNWKKLIEEEKPDLIIIAYGTNELISNDLKVIKEQKLKEKWEDLITEMISLSNAKILLVETPQLENKNNLSFTSFIKNIAKENKLLFQENVFSLETVQSLKEEKIMAKDGVHFTKYGYELLSEDLAYSILNLLEK